MLGWLRFPSHGCAHGHWSFYNRETSWWNMDISFASFFNKNFLSISVILGTNWKEQELDHEPPCPSMPHNRKWNNTTDIFSNHKCFSKTPHWRNLSVLPWVQHNVPSCTNSKSRPSVSLWRWDCSQQWDGGWWLSVEPRTFPQETRVLSYSFHYNEFP